LLLGCVGIAALLSVPRWAAATAQWCLFDNRHGAADAAYAAQVCGALMTPWEGSRRSVAGRLWIGGALRP